MDVSKTPPVFPGGFSACGNEIVGKSGVFAQKMRFEQLQDARYGGQDRDAFAMDGRNQPGRVQLRFKVDFSSQKCWNPEPHKLSEDMAEWKAMQEAQRMHPTLILEVFLHLAFDRSHAGEDVLVSVNDPLWLRSRPRGEDDLERALVSDGGVDGEERFGRERCLKFREGQQRLGIRKSGQQRWVADDNPRRDIGDDACREGREPARSSGTAMTPRSRQPKKAAIHSAEFSPQTTTRSPGPMLRRVSSAEKRPARLASPAYEVAYRRLPR